MSEDKEGGLARAGLNKDGAETSGQKQGQRERQLMKMNRSGIIEKKG